MIVSSVSPCDVLHHDEEDVVLLLRGRDGDDVGMIDAGEQARLAQQLAEVEVLLVRNLDRDLLVDPGVSARYTVPNPPLPSGGEDFVLAEDLSLEQHPTASIAATRTAVDRPRPVTGKIVPVQHPRAYAPDLDPTQPITALSAEEARTSSACSASAPGARVLRLRWPRHRSSRAHRDRREGQRHPVVARTGAARARAARAADARPGRAQRRQDGHRRPRRDDDGRLGRDSADHRAHRRSRDRRWNWDASANAGTASPSPPPSSAAAPSSPRSVHPNG